MHDVAWRGMWICVRSKDAQKQLARTSLIYFAVLILDTTAVSPAMNDLPAIGYRAMRKELWDRQGANIAIAGRKCMAKSCFHVQRQGFWREINTFSP